MLLISWILTHYQLSLFINLHLYRSSAFNTVVILKIIMVPKPLVYQHVMVYRDKPLPRAVPSMKLRK